MDDELLKGLDDLRNAASKLSSQLAWAVAGTQTAEDSRGAVSLTLTAESAVTGFTLRPRWRQLLNQGQLGAAIVEAFNNAAEATMKAFASRAKQIVEGVNVPHAERRPASTSGLPAAGREEAVAFARKLDQALIEANERIGELQELVISQARRPRRIASRGGMVHLVVSNNVLAQVDIDEHWLRHTADSAIEKELIEVLRSACPGISRHARQAVTAIPAVSSILAAASRPADLLRQLGLTGRRADNG